MRAGLSLLFAALLPALVLSAGCKGRQDDRPVRVDISGTPADLRRPLDATRTPAGQTMLAATAQGMLAFDARGELLPALAESWIVADDGRSLIFRLRQARWPDDSPVRAPEVAALLRQRMKASPRLLAGLSPEVRAMTDRVMEIRLDAPLPGFLQLLAQPAMAIQRGAAPGGTGPYRPRQQGPGWLLEPVRDPDEDGNEPDIPANQYRSLQAVSAPMGAARFLAGRSDALLGGRFQDLPLLAASNMPGEAVRADPVQGLFGLAVEARSGPLADRVVRIAVSAAIDREQIARDLGLAGWTVTTALLPAPMDLGRPPSLPAWSALPLEERRAAARRAIEQWRAAEGEPDPIRIALPRGSGARLLFFRLAAELRGLGLQARAVAWDASADLRLIDEVAPFESALWYLARLDCANGMSCDRAASDRLDDARRALTPSALALALSEAELLMTRHGAYIPIGMPIRWSLVSPRLTGFAASPRGRHPLNSLVTAPK